MTDASLPVTRRRLVKALTSGVAVHSVATGSAAAHEDRDESRVHARYGVPVPDVGALPASFEPDHVVELHTDLPADLEDPDRPPFFHFEPAGLHVECDDIVQFTLVSPDHTVTAYHPAHGFQQRVPDGSPPFSSPVVNVGGAWLYQFETEGVYDFYCGPHHVLGMVGRVVSGNLEDAELPDYVDAFEGQDDPPLFAPFSKGFLEHELNAVSEHNDDCEWPWLTPAEVLQADALHPGAIQKHGAVSFDAVLEDTDRFSASSG